MVDKVKINPDRKRRCIYLGEDSEFSNEELFINTLRIDGLEMPEALFALLSSSIAVAKSIGMPHDAFKKMSRMVWEESGKKEEEKK